MLENTLSIKINKPLQEVFTFCITPPNSSRWIPGVVAEETSEWPIRVGTVYKLQNETGDWFEVIVSAIQENNLVEWTKGTYHCRYTFKVIDEQTTELTYHEWVDSGTLDEPFAQKTLEQLKRVVGAENK